MKYFLITVGIGHLTDFDILAFLALSVLNFVTTLREVLDFNIIYGEEETICDTFVILRSIGLIFAVALLDLAAHIFDLLAFENDVFTFLHILQTHFLHFEL